jgi:hypothetical protein
VNRVLISLASLFAVTISHAHAPVVGRYRLLLPESAARVAKISGKDAPYGRLELREGGRFALITEDVLRRGRFVVDGNRLILVPDSGKELRGDLRNDHIVLEGLEFEPDAVRRFPTDASTGRLLGPPPAELYSPQREDRVQISEPITVNVRIVEPLAMTPTIVAARHLEMREVSGTWTVHRNGLEEKGLRMDLRTDGTFRFTMTGATSEGTWSTRDGSVLLVWTKIDGEPVDDGTVHKEIAVSEDNQSFKIDTYRYERASS